MSDSGYSYFLKYPKCVTERLEEVFAEVPDDLKVFRVSLYVKQFYPEDISVKVVDRKVIIRGEHREHVDTHGFVTREFRREYVLPDIYDPKSVSSTLTLEGVLNVYAYHKDLWEEFVSEEKDNFQAYISIESDKLSEFSFKVKDGNVELKTKSIDTEFGEEEEINEKYNLPKDVVQSTVTTRFVEVEDYQILELEGQIRPQEATTDPPSEQKNSKDSPENQS